MLRTEAERRLATLSMDDMPIMEVPAILASVDTDWFPKYKALRREFMKSLTDSMEELSLLNVNQEDFMNLILGKSLPENLSLRFRIPLVYGGKIDVQNMFMCRTFPHSYNMDRFIIEQEGSSNIWVPNPAKKVYVPANMLGGGAGGNATEDRLAQLSAQFAANMGYGME